MGLGRADEINRTAAAPHGADGYLRLLHAYSEHNLTATALCQHQPPPPPPPC